MCMYVNECVYICIYCICICIYTCVYVRIYVCAYTYIGPNYRALTILNQRICDEGSIAEQPTTKGLYACVYMRVCIYVCGYMCVCVCVCPCVRVCPCVTACVYMYTANTFLLIGRLHCKSFRTRAVTRHPQCFIRLRLRLRLSLRLRLRLRLDLNM